MVAQVSQALAYGSYGFVMPDGRAGVSSGSYGFVVPDIHAGVSLAVAMAFRAKAVRTYRGGSYGCFAPKLYGCIEAVAKAVSHQSCADVSRRS